MSFQISRLREDLVELGKLGRKNSRRIEYKEELDDSSGLFRPTGSERNRASRDYIIERMKSAGLEVEFDAVGNIYGIKRANASSAGREDDDREAVMTGSHIDSVRDGGQFDGALGVVSALEVLRALSEEDFTHSRDLIAVVLTAEEGSAFPRGLVGSEYISGRSSADELLSLKDERGRTLKQALSGYRGDFELDISRLAAFIELHPEQGPNLAESGIPLGLVERITGISWVRFTIRGEADHAGTTPMSGRSDALAAASHLITEIEEIAGELARNSASSPVATVGELNVHPGAANIVPGRVDMKVDIRDTDEDNMARLRDEIIETAYALRRKGLEIESEVLFHIAPAVCAEKILSTLDRAADSLDIVTLRMVSGAAHDAQNFADKVDTAMMFLPSVDGISHSPYEWTEWEDIEKGGMVLSEALRDLAGADSSEGTCINQNSI